jgi:outer membrane lipoprotein SlyB
MRLPITRIHLIAVAAFGCAVASSNLHAQSTTVSYGRITAVSQVEIRNQDSQAAGALIGGLAGLATGSGQSGSNRALRGLGGAAIGGRVGAAAGSSTGFEYTVLIDGSRTIRMVTEQAGLRVGDCVSVERGGFNNIRLAADERCETGAGAVPAQAAAAANACVMAKEQLLAAETDDDFDRAERRVRLLCD